MPTMMLEEQTKLTAVVERPAPRLSSAEVRFERIELAQEMVQLVIGDGLADAPGDVAQNLSIAKLCLEAAKTALPKFERRERNGDHGRGSHSYKRRKGMQ